MTQGFDAATPQQALNFAAVTGQQFVIIKATGANVGLYVAPAYHAEHEHARAKGLHLGHTHLTGVGSATEQARYFVGHLFDFDLDHDLLALDNEKFPDEPGSELWADAKVAEFWSEVFRLLPGLAHHHALTYMGASNARDGGTWAKTNALGIRWWIAAYGDNDGQRHPLAPLPHMAVAIHQYTSRGKLAGVTVDLDWSPLSIEDLFGAAAPAAVKAHQAVAAASKATRAAAAKPVPQTSTVLTGSPGPKRSACWKRMQLLARKGGYAGVIDGDLQVNSWKGIQRYLAAHYGYHGSIDGDPQELTYKALQRLAAAHGYDGPIDGDPQRATWRHLAGYLNTLPS